MKLLDKVIGTMIAVIMAVMVLGCCWQVITRFILQDPSKYTEEFLRYALIWLTMLGTPFAYGRGKHLSIHLMTSSFQPKNMAITRIVIELIVIALSVGILIVGGIKVTTNSSGQISPAMMMPMEAYYICVPICGVLMVIYAVNRLLSHIKELREG
jgi:TRAP-type C4-dicarboxylate transport system permease small subunit